MSAPTAIYASTEPVEAKIESVTERGFILRVGKEAIPVEDSSKTKFWQKRTAVTREAITQGALVWVRIGSSGNLREMADKESWIWLEANRKTIRQATVTSIDTKYVKVKFEDGSTFDYRVTPKSKITIKGKDVSMAELAEGQKLYVKGRTLATLDTWMVSASDVAPPKIVTVSGVTKGSGKSSNSKKEGSPDLSGRTPIIGSVNGVVLSWNILKVDVPGNTLNVTYNNETVFTFLGKKIRPNAIDSAMRARITYWRDHFGRIIAIKVELS